MIRGGGGMMHGDVKKLLLTGGSGQVGSAIIAVARAYGFTVSAPPRDTLDLTKADDIVAAVGSDDWSIIINCAGYTDVDEAQGNQVQAGTVNRVAPGIFASEAALRNIPIIHLSTDYVFDGSKNTPYTEDDLVYPLGVYGASMEAGEAAVRAANPAHAIIRTAWVVSAGRKNFIDTMLTLAQNQDEIAVVSDQTGSPTSADDLAAAILLIARQMIHSSKKCTGTWHFVNAGITSWYDLAAFIFENIAARGLKVPELRAITTSDYSTEARRPPHSKLDTARITRVFQINPRPWQAAIKDIIDTRLLTDIPKS